MISRNRAIGTLLVAAAWLLVSAVVVLALASALQYVGPGGIGLLQNSLGRHLPPFTAIYPILSWGNLFWLIVVRVSVYFATSIAQLGRRFLARSAEEIRLLDPRPPVIYLRMFASDKITSRTAGPQMSPLMPMAFYRLMHSTTEEEQLAKALKSFGPLLGIGNPGEALPTLGAHRLYVNHSEWHQHVDTLLRQAALVVMRMGTTEGISWEVSTCVKSVDPVKIILMVPDDPDIVNRFLSNNASQFPKGLPPIDDDSGVVAGSIIGIIYFGEDWTPRFQANTFRGRREPVAEALAGLLQPIRVALRLRKARDSQSAKS